MHAWAALQVYRSEEVKDRKFLAKVFHKLLLNFSWWVNRKDADGSYLFEGGFLGMDNIGPVNRSEPMLGQWRLEQSDATSWMAAYSLHLMQIALELARHDESYEDVATKFVEHFLSIAEASTQFGSGGRGIWDETDGFCYDVVSRRRADGHVESQPVRVRSMVGLIPVLACAVLEPWVFEELPDFARRLEHLLAKRPELQQFLSRSGGGALLSLLDERKLRRVLSRMLDEGEFLSPHGIRSLSAAHREGLEVQVADQEHRMGYEPGESRTPMFGGNSNWRGPVWFPINVLIIRALLQHYRYYGDELTIECPTGSGHQLTLFEVAKEIADRLIATFLQRPDGTRPVYGGTERFQEDPHWRDLILFYEYFHGDNGAGLGASHQTGWTGLVAPLIQLFGHLTPEAVLEPEVRPAGLVRRPEAGAVVALEVLVEQDQVAPVGVGLERLCATVDRPPPRGVPQEDGRQPVGQLLGHREQGQPPARPGRALHGEVVPVVGVELQEGPDEQDVHREPHRPPPVGVAAEHARRRLGRLVRDGVADPGDGDLVGLGEVGP